MRLHQYTGISSRIQHRPNLPKPQDLIKRWDIIRGDEVMITEGKDQGKTGKVLHVLRDRNRLLITGLNLAWKHVPKTAESAGGKIQKEMPVHYSNVHLLDPITKRPCKINIRKVKDDKTGKMKNQRFVSGTNTMIPRPVLLEYQTERKDGPFDTLPDAVQKVTFVPSLSSFPLPKGVINELRSPYRAISDMFIELKRLERKKEELTDKLHKATRPKYPGYVPGGTKPRIIPAVNSSQA
ncbi:39S ribosomal protein L24, mitochondrial [Entomophthora muscae]|uniref:39S ribosomal protein L24, mitochondrial n=2 Tax=Entomophthora muscae TaxID=34485 RepID=A0ACC2UNS5_9FUNG|nr:39S ribosomal protein L24, mitochondrial [Entomophthora muscae]